MPRTPTPDAEPRAPAGPGAPARSPSSSRSASLAALAAIPLGRRLRRRPPAARPAGPGVPVAVGEVTREAVPVLVEAIGAVEARSTVSVRPQVGGEVTALHFQAGDDVARGQLLASIDPRTYRAALDQAQAQLERDKVRAANARQDVARYAELVAKDYVTRQQYEQSVADAQALRGHPGRRPGGGGKRPARPRAGDHPGADRRPHRPAAGLRRQPGQGQRRPGVGGDPADGAHRRPLRRAAAVPGRDPGPAGGPPGGRPGGRGGPTAAGGRGGPALSGDSHLHRQRRRFGHRHHRAQGHLSQPRPRRCGPASSSTSPSPCPPTPTRWWRRHRRWRPARTATTSSSSSPTSASSRGR